MRHGNQKIINAADRDHKNSIIRNLLTNLVTRDKVETTEARAKVARQHFERMLTTVRGQSKMNAIRYLNGILYTEEACRKVLEVLLPKYEKTVGGCTRIIKTDYRQGDGAHLALLELV